MTVSTKSAWMLSALLALTMPALAAERVTRVDIYVEPYYAAAESPDGRPTVAIGKTFDELLSSTKREDIVAARDKIASDPKVITPMTMMVLAIRLYDLGLRDDSVFWFYAANACGRRRHRQSRPLRRRCRGEELCATRRSGDQRLRLLRHRQTAGDPGQGSRLDRAEPVRRHFHGGSSCQVGRPTEGARFCGTRRQGRRRQGKRLLQRSAKLGEVQSDAAAERNGRQILLGVIR